MRGDFSQAREHARCKVLVEQLDDAESGAGGGGAVANVARSTHGGARVTDRAILPPFDEIVPGDWLALLAEGRERGVVHADHVAQVLRYVELSEEAIALVRITLRT